jgi:hypothetical protein
MAKKPSARFGSCGEFARQLGQRLSPGFAYAHDVPVPLYAQRTQPAIGITTRPPTGKRLSRSPGVVIAALVAVALLIVGGVFAVVKFTQPHSRAATAPSKTATAPPNTGIAPPNTGTAPPSTPAAPLGTFTGTYRADFGPVTDPDGNPVAGAAPSVGTYGLRSVCEGAGCVATASRLSGESTFASRMVFDGIDGRWVAVALSANPCRGAVGEIWEVFTLQPRPDGTLTGQHTRSARNNCQEMRTVTFTRTGDVDLNSLPDPATLPPRVVSPAEALHGHYQLTRTFTNGQPQVLGDSTIVTDCLRTGDRCMSYFHAKMGDVPLVFGGGTWTWDESSDGKCPNGSPAHLNANGQYPLPQPPQNPISLLSGHGHWQQNGSCAVTLDFDETFTRTGD